MHALELQVKDSYKKSKEKKFHQYGKKMKKEENNINQNLLLKKIVIDFTSKEFGLENIFQK